MYRNINYIKTTLFDSTIARFKLTVESRLTRNRQDNGSIENLCFVSESRNSKTGQVQTTLNLNPNIYLVFSYRGDSYETSKALYMSYPQMSDLRDALTNVKNLLLAEDSFIDNEGLLGVNPTYAAPVILSEIGKDKKWISFTLGVLTNAEGTAGERGVIVEISGNNREVSTLSLNEFITIWTIVNDMDLATFQTNFGLFFMLNENFATQQTQYQPAAPVYGYAPPAANYGGGYPAAAPQQGYVQRPATPRYNNNNNGGYRSYQANGQTAAPQRAQAPAQAAPVNKMPARDTAAPIVNLNSVEEAPIDETAWDDDESLAKIFDGQ